MTTDQFIVDDNGHILTQISCGNLAQVGSTHISNVVSAHVVITGQTSLDAVSGAPFGVSFEEHKLHEGDHFTFTGLVTGIDSGDISKYHIRTPDTTKWGHFLIKFNSEAKMSFYVYETTSYDPASAGTTVTAFNNNRNSATVSGLVIKQDPVIVNSGTEIFIEQAGSEAANPTGVSQEAGIVGREDEIILKQNTGYIFAMVSVDDGNYASAHADWFEHVSVA